jgi:hypothetical protein
MLTVNPAELHGMLTDLSRTAGTDSTLPMLNGILLHVDTKVDSTVLVGSSTDRLRFGQAHAPATGEIPATFVSMAQVRQLLDTLKPYSRTHDLLAEVTVEDRVKLTVKLPGDLVLPAVTITVHCSDDSDFPKAAKILDTQVVEGIGQLGFNPAYVAAFSAIAKRRNEHLRIDVSHDHKPSMFYVGDRYRALLMPVRLHDDQMRIPAAFVPPREKPATEDSKAA